MYHRSSNTSTFINIKVQLVQNTVRVVGTRGGSETFFGSLVSMSVFVSGTL